MRQFFTQTLNLKRFSKNLKKVVCFFIAVSFVLSADAQNYTPNIFTDPVFTAVNNATGAITAGAGIGSISLRSALKAADNVGGTHIVTLSTGNYILDGTGTYTYAGPVTVTLRTILLGITSQNITINGNGPANTFITMAATGRDRMFLINPDGSTNSPVISFSGITFQNAYLTSDAYGGGAIYAGGGSAESLTVTNCAFLNNTTPAGNGGGAAIKMDVRGNLTVDNCTFTNNVSNDADGAAILNIIYGSTLGTGYGTLSVTNSTFTNNNVVVPSASTADGGSVSIRSQGGVTPFNATVTNNTFLNNSADGYGGAIIVVNSAAVSTVQVNYNRFVGNTSGTSALSSGLYMTGAGNVNADNNWWGCNTNPVNVASTAPCNQAYRDPSGGTLTLTKWLQLKTTASASPICPNATSTVTASFLTNSAGDVMTLANLSRLINLPVTWGPTTNGSLSATQTTIQTPGTATATFTSNGTGGVTATINTQVDNVPSNETSPARASITVSPNNTAGAPSSNPTVCINTAISPNITIATTNTVSSLVGVLSSPTLPELTIKAIKPIYIN